MCPHGVEDEIALYVNCVPQNKSKIGSFLCSELSTFTYPLHSSEDLNNNNNNMTSYLPWIIHR